MSFWYQKPAPRLLFHGTLYKHLESIKRHGLLEGTHERANYQEYADDVAGYISLTDSPATARQFALFAWGRTHDKNEKRPDLIVLEVDALKAAMIAETTFNPMRGKLSQDYHGHEYLAVGNIPREAIVGAHRYHYVNGASAEDYIRL